jgi:hypothetical protein
MCSPTSNIDWAITDQQICNGVQVSTGLGNITISSSGNLTLINGANITTNEVRVNGSGDKIFIIGKSELRSQ